MTIKEIIDEKFGGVKNMAKMLGHKNATTVYYWCHKNNIPQWRFAEIERIANQNNIDIKNFSIKKD